MNKTWLVYGATGYTGQLIVEEAHKQGLNLIMAGRSEDKLAEMKKQFGYEYRCFDLSSRQTIASQLEDVDVALNCAGPFSETAKPFIAACLHAQAHYLDITGEIAVFEHAHLLDHSAEKANIVVCPGVGFDVVPTDCLAKALSEKLPDADTLWLGFSSRSALSPGTAKTSVEAIGDGGKVRRDGKIIDVPLAYRVRKIDFGDGSCTATTIPWGDVSTAFYSTGIQNIDVYIPLSDNKVKQMKRLEKFRWIMKSKWLVNFLKRRIDAKVRGPNEDKRARLETKVWGEVMNPAGDIVTGRITTANGYDLTGHAAIAISQHLLNNDIEPGFKTPSMIMGSSFVEQLPRSSTFVWEDTRSEGKDALE